MRDVPSREIPLRTRAVQNGQRTTSQRGIRQPDPRYHGAGPIVRQKSKVSQAAGMPTIVVDPYEGMEGDDAEFETPPYQPRRPDPDARRAPRSAIRNTFTVPADPVEEEYEDAFEAERAEKARRDAQQFRNLPARYQPKRVRRRFHPVAWVAGSITLFLLLFILLTAGLHALGSWWQDHQDNSDYGFPRTYQMDAVVGLGDSANHPSHFVAMNLNGRGTVIDFPGGDPDGAVLYDLKLTIMGDQATAAKLPITLTFTDITGDGRPDMIVKIGRQDQGGQIEYWINDPHLGKFRPTSASDRIYPPAS